MNRDLESRLRDWQKPREDRELSPEKLFQILSSIDGEKRAIEKMMDLGIDVSQWIKAEGRIRRNDS